MAGITKTPQKKMEDNLLQISQHKEDIRIAAEDATKLIAEAATAAARVISEAASVAVKLVSSKDAEDHDLLIELRTTMEYVRSDIRDLSNGVTEKISELQKNKVDRKDFEELKTEIHTTREDRVKKLEDGYANVVIIMNNVKNTNKWFIAAASALFCLLLMHVLGIVQTPHL
jgi:hypothetical protein